MGVLSAAGRGARALGCAATLAIALGAGATWAAPPDPTAERRTAARALADKGYAHYQAGRFAEAVATLERAEALFHAPTLAFALAKAYVAAGRLRDARRVYQQIVEEKLPPTAPADYRRAQVSAAVELTALSARIPSVRVVIEGAAGRRAAVSVDGASVAEAALADRIELDAGKHVVRVRVEGAAPPIEITREITLAEGARESLTVALPGALPSLARTPPGTPPVPAPPQRGSPAPGIAALGVGAAALAVGIGTGVDVLARAAKIKEQCRDEVCPVRLEPDARAARTEATVSTIAFAVAGAAVAAGVVLVIVRPGARSGARAAIAIGPGSVGFSGRF